MRILHTSDWHIGRQIYNVSLLEDQRYVLEQMVDICKTKKVDVVLIAGDLYDRAIPPANAVALVDDILNQICNELDIPVIVIAGNHDGPERLGFAYRQLEKGNLYITGLLQAEINPVILQDKHGDVAFYPIPYADPATVRDVFDSIDSSINSKDDDSEATQLSTHDQCMQRVLQQIPDQENNRSVVISHCFISGGKECESERPLSVGGAEQVSASHFKRFSYTALGHLHRPQKQSLESIRYSGSILKYSFSEEQHKKSITLVDMDEKGHCSIEQLALKSLRDMRSISGAMDDIIADAKNDPHKDDYLLISLTDKHAILDPMNKLRQVYPNILHLERPGLMSQNTQKLTNRDVLNKSKLSMFEDFYQQVQGDDLTEDQQKIMTSLIDDLQLGDV